MKRPAWPKIRIWGLAVALATLLSLLGCSTEETPLPSFHRWGKIEMIFRGPTFEGLGEPNPFEIAFDVMFTGPDGSTYLVPGFYDGDGQGSLDGSIWKVRFSADQNGVWSWHTQSTEATMDGLSGHIGVVDPLVESPDLYKLGRLEYADQRYLKFREGGYWIKAGTNEPENLLGGALGYKNWKAKKEQIDYLASTGVNSVYVITHNLEGDAQDVWPWVGTTQEEAKRNLNRFDVLKLEHWRDLFEHMQSRGLIIHLVLEDDAAWIGHDYTQYYREMVARFGYLPAICFNFAEQHQQVHSLAESLDFMNLLATIDPYNHPRAIHNVNFPLSEYVDSPAVQMASIQTQPSRPATLNQLAVDWFAASLARRRRPLVVGFNEAHPAADRRSWWSVYLGGGVWESLLWIESGFREHEPTWLELALVRQFLEPLPVESMFPANHLISDGQAFCLAKPGEVYAVYLPEGGKATLQLVEGNRYQVSWFNPRLGTEDPWARLGGIVEGGPFHIDSEGDQDWALKIERIEGENPGPPVAISAKLISQYNEPVLLHLATLPVTPDPSAKYRVLTQPKAGQLMGEAPDLIYTPRPGFTGRDSFLWQRTGDTGITNVATVEIFCNASGEATPPSTYDQTMQATAGEPAALTLRYIDRDGFGPYRIYITKYPAHGTLEGLDNEYTYIAEDGFTGTDQFEWQVDDGAARSDTARASIRVLR